MALLNRDQILAADDLRTMDVPVPEWGGEVRIRTLTGTERDKFESSLTKQTGNTVKADTSNYRAKLVSQVIVDENGQRMFNPADVDALGRKSLPALQRVFAAAQKLNGLGQSVEVETENFDEAPAPDGQPSSTV